MFKNFGACVRVPMSLWRLFEYMELETNQRQKEDLVWANCLNRIRMGTETTDDVTLLQSRIIRPQNDEENQMSTMQLSAMRFKKAVTECVIVFIF